MEKHERIIESSNIRRLVSVIVPIYSKSLLVIQTLESVKAQTFPNVELIVVADGNLPVEIDPSLINKLSDIVVKLPQSGVSVARNAGFVAGHGDYFLFLDHDDILHPEMVASLVSILDAEASLSACACDIIRFSGNQPGFDSTQRESSLTYAGPHDSLLESAKSVGRQFIVPSSILYRRTAFEKIGLFDPYYPFSGDFELLIRCVHCSRIGLLHRNLLYYRTHSNNFSKQYLTGLMETKLLCKRLSLHSYVHGEKVGWSVFRRFVGAPNIVFSYQAIDAARVSMRERKYTDVVRHLLVSFVLCPLPLITSCLNRLLAK